MNREIKFRLWYELKMYFTKSIDKMLFEDGHYFEHSGAKYPYNIMQFTGLSDMNGKEIYEGDIIATMFHKKEGNKTIRLVKEMGYEVIFKNGCYMWADEPLGYEYEEDKFIPLETVKWATIIGNIFENPEMLLVTYAIT
jgi:uncharacterized phage protein (TIGR01671 family)